MLNWVGCCLGGCRHATADNALAALAEFSGPAEATVLGRNERLDILHAALLNGMTSHALDYDDTHLETIIRPARLKAMFGTMCKPLHPGRAAQGGLTAALLASRDFTSTEEGLEAAEGFAFTMADEPDLSQIADDLGGTFEISRNTLRDGRTLNRHIEHALGSLENPMTDEALERKFLDQAQGVIPDEKLEELVARRWEIESLDNVRELTAAAAA